MFDKGNRVWDANTSQTTLNLFKKWFAERKLFGPHANIWNFDLGKLVVPSVVMDYDRATRVVRRIDGEILITISLEEIREAFHLAPLTMYHVPINLKYLEK